MGRKFRLLLAAGTVVAAAIAATTALAQTHARGAEPFKIALSNSFIGNKWRIEMENDFKSACGMPPYKTEVQCSVYNSGNDVSKQTQQISNLISQGVNAILVDAASGTGLNGIIQQACARHIVVVAYDNLVTAPCAIKINGSQYAYGQQNAQYIVDKLQGQGQRDHGDRCGRHAGRHRPEHRARRTSSRSTRASRSSPSTPGCGTRRPLSGTRRSSCRRCRRSTASGRPAAPTAILKAMLAAGRPLPTVVGGEGENGYRRFLVGYNGKKLQYGLSLGQPPFNVVVALEVARAVLAKAHAVPKETVWLPFPQATEKTAKLGVNVFTNVPDSFFDAFTDSGPEGDREDLRAGRTHRQGLPRDAEGQRPVGLSPGGAN